MIFVIKLELQLQNVRDIPSVKLILLQKPRTGLCIGIVCDEYVEQYYKIN